LKLRPGKIFVDYLRTGAARRRWRRIRCARVPVRRSRCRSRGRKLKALKRGDAFDMDKTLARIKRQRKDPWAGSTHCVRICRPGAEA
jgi:DNA primase